MAAHRYWRVYITATGGGYVSMMELQLRTSIGGSNVATGGTASASSTDFGWVAANAFDGSTGGNGWHSGTNALPSTPEWIKYDFGSGNDKDIVEFAIYPRFAQMTQWPHSFLLQYSDDDSSWTTLYTIQDYYGWVEGAYKAFSADDLYTLKKRWRLYVTATQGGNVGVAELVLKTSPGGSQAATGGVAIASAYYSGFVPSSAFDADNSTMWFGPSAVPHWVGYEFASATDIVEFSITAPQSPDHNSAPKTFKLQYSDGSGGWTDHTSVTNDPNWSAGETRTFGSAPARTSDFFLVF